jgi:undecaprenyl-diphosphatase
MSDKNQNDLDLRREALISKENAFGFWKTLKSVIVYHWKWYSRYKFWLIGITGLTSLVALGIVRPLEKGFTPWLRTICPPKKWDATAEFISWSGEYAFLLFILLGSLLFGWILRQRRLILVAHCLLASLIFSTLVTRTGKATIGRLRPGSALQMQVGDTFIGPTMESKYHSFPSGHTSASFSGAAPLFLSHPVIGTPAIIYASCVSLSRAHKNQHYLSDLIAGLWIGLAASLPTYSLLKRRH